jgi:hypothetical protein
MHWVLWSPILFLFSYYVRLILRHFPESTPFQNYQKAQETTQHYRLAQLFKTEAPRMRRRAEEWTMVTLRVMLPVHTCSGRNHIIPLMRRRNTDSAPNKPVTWPRNHLLIRGHEFRPHCHDTVLRYVVTLQVCTRLRLQTRAQNMWYWLLFHGNCGYANAP